MNEEKTKETEPKKNEPIITIDDFMRIIYDVFLHTKTRQLFVGNEKSHTDNPNPQDFLNLAYSILKNVSIRIRCKYCIQVSFTGPDTISIKVKSYMNIADYIGTDKSAAFETKVDGFKVEIEKQPNETDEVVLQHILGMADASIPMYLVDNNTITNEPEPSDEQTNPNDDNLLSNKIYEIINSISQQSESVYIFVEYVKNQQTITIDKIAVYNSLHAPVVAFRE